MLKHVVMLKFKPDAADAQIAEVEKQLSELPGIIPEIREYVIGRDIVRSDRSYDFAIVSAFDDLDALQRYGGHPKHQEVLTLIREICEDIKAVDFNF